MGMMATFLSACSGGTGLGMDRAPRLDPNDPDAALKYKFRGLSGGVKCVSAMRGLSTEYTVVYAPEGYAYAIGNFGTGLSTSSYGVGGTDRLVIPKYLHMVRYPKGAKFLAARNSNEFTSPRFEGPGEFEITVSVAERIPDDLLADLRRNPKGTLRLKLRIHPETLLVGWDIERRPNPWGYTQKEINDGKLYLAPAWSHTGGDFKEARFAHYIWEGDRLTGMPTDIPQWHKGIPPGLDPWRWQGFINPPTPEQMGFVVPTEWAKRGLYINAIKKLWMEKGWYIDPRTKERIETDF